MPVRVNKRFVLLLFAVMVLLVGGLAAFYFAFVRTTPEENRRQAELFFAQGDYNRAVQYLGKALHKRSDDVDLIYRYVEMLRLAEVDTAADAGDRLKRIVDLHRRAVEAQPRDKQVLDRLYRLLYDLTTKQEMGGFYMGWLGDLTQVKLSSVSEGPIADVARRYRGIALTTELAPDSSPQNRQLVFEDLQHALEVNPDDHLAAHYLARWTLIEADRLQQERTSSERLEELRESAYELSRQTLADPEAPRRLERLALHAELLGSDELTAYAQERAAVLGELERHLREHREPRWLFAETARQLYNAQRSALAAAARADERGDVRDLSLIRRAIALLELGSETFPEDATLHRLRGQLLALERPDDAIEAFRAAVEIDEAGRTLEVLRAARAEDVSRIAIGNLLLAKADSLDSSEARQAIYDEVQSHIEAVEQTNAGNPAATLLLGRLQLARGDNQKALATLDRASKLYNHRNVEALRLLASASERLGQWGNTQRQLERLISLVPNSPRHWLALTEAQLRSKNLEAATQSFEQARSLAPDHPGLPLLEARLAAATRDFDRAIELLEGIGDEQRAVAVELLVELYRRTGREEDAARLAIEHFESDPANLNSLRLALRAVDDAEREAAMLAQAEAEGAPQAAIDLLRERVIEGRSPDMEEITTRAVAEIENPADRRVAEGRLALAKGDLEQARQAADEVLASSPDHTRAIELAFQVAVKRGDYGVAEAMAQRAGELNADYAEGRFYDGRLAAARERWDEAAVAFERGLNLRPVYSRGWTMLGQARAETGDHTAAATAFERAVEQKPDNIEARLALAQAYDRLFEPDRALETLEQARRFAPRDARVFRALADYYATQGRLDDAIALRRDWATRRPDDTANRRAIVALLAADQRGDEALSEVKALIDERGMSRPLAVLLAQVHRRNGDPERGLDTLTSYVSGLGDEAGPDDHRAVARYLAAIGRVDAAVDRFRTATAMAEASRPGDTSIHRELGDTLFNTGRFEQAAEVYQRIHAIEPEDATTRLRLAETLVRLNRGDEARALLGEAPQEGTSLVLLAMAAQQAGDHEQARRLADRAIEDNPDHREARLLRARLAASSGDADLAITDVNRVLSQRPDDATARNLLAGLQAATGNYIAAAREYEALLDRSPRSDALRGQLVRTLLRAGRGGEALRVAQRGLEIDPSSLRWARAVGELAFAMNRLEEARDAWQRVIAQEPQVNDLFQYSRLLLRLERPSEVLSLLDKHPMALGESPRLQVLRARALFDTGDEGAAQQVARRALERSGDAAAMSFVASTASDILGPARTIEHMQSLPGGRTPGMRIAMGRVAARSGQWSAAVEHFGAAWNELPADAGAVRLTVLSQLAASLHQAGRHEQAVERYEQYLEQRPNDSQVLNNYAFLLASDMDDPARALPLAERAVNVAGPNATVLDTLGWIQHLLGRHEQAIATLRRSTDFQALPANHYHLGRALTAAGRHTEAREALERAIELAESRNDAEVRDQARAALNELTKSAS